MPGGFAAARQTLVFHAGLEQSDVTHLRLAHLPVGHGLKQGAGALVEVARSDRPGAHSSLALPRRGPALRVLLMRGDGAAHRTILPLGAQVEVDNDAELAGRRTEEFLDPINDRSGAGRGLRVGGTTHGFMQGDDVGVGGVGALAPAVAPHRHEGDVGALAPPPLGFLPPRNRERSEQCSIRRVGDGVPARVDSAK